MIEKLPATPFQKFAVNAARHGNYRPGWRLAAWAGRLAENYRPVRAAAEIFIQRPYRDGAVRTELRELLAANLADAGADKTERANLIRALGAAKDVKAVDLLIGTVDWAHDPKKREADFPAIENSIVALGRIGSEIAVTHLEGVLRGTLKMPPDIRLWPAAAASLLAIPGRIEPAVKMRFRTFEAVGRYASDYLWHDNRSFHGEVLPGKVSASRVARFGKDALPALRCAFESASPAARYNLLALMLICDRQAGERYGTELLDRLTREKIDGIDHGKITILLAQARLGRVKLI